MLSPGQQDANGFDGNQHRRTTPDKLEGLAGADVTPEGNTTLFDYRL
jgi:hypothetical protein